MYSTVAGADCMPLAEATSDAECILAGHELDDCDVDVSTGALPVVDTIEIEGMVNIFIFLNNRI